MIPNRVTENIIWIILGLIVAIGIIVMLNSCGYVAPPAGYYRQQPVVIFTPGGDVIHCVPAGMGNYGCW